MPQFFFPLVEPDKQEEAYQEIARFIGAVPLPHGKRVYSMTWKHDRTVWTATVGEKFRGIETKAIGRGRDRRDREIPRSTNDTVLAIFPGSPGLIAHDRTDRYWELPILTGPALKLTRFD